MAFLLIIISSSLAFAEGRNGSNTIQCPLKDDKLIEIDLREQFSDLDPHGYLSVVDPQGNRISSINKILCLGKFLPGYIGSMSCIGLIDRNLIRVNIKQRYISWGNNGEDINDDIYLASVFYERDNKNQLINLADKVTCKRKIF